MSEKGYWNLKPCVCGQPARLGEGVGVDSPDGTRKLKHYVVCSDHCGMVRFGNTEAEAVAAWNNRPEEERLRNQIKAATEAAEKVQNALDDAQLTENTWQEAYKLRAELNGFMRQLWAALEPKLIILHNDGTTTEVTPIPQWDPREDK